MESWGEWDVRQSVRGFFWPGHQLGAEGSVPTALWNRFVESTSITLWLFFFFFSLDFFFSPCLFTSLFYFLRLVMVLWWLVAPTTSAKSRAGGGWREQPQPHVSGTSTALPHNLSVSSEVRAKAAQQGHVKTDLEPQETEHPGKQDITVQTSGSPGGDGSHLPSHHLSWKLACENIFYCGWGHFRELPPEEMKYDEQTHPMVIFSHPSTPII